MSLITQRTGTTNWICTIKRIHLMLPTFELVAATKLMRWEHVQILKRVLKNGYKLRRRSCIQIHIRHALVQSVADHTLLRSCSDRTILDTGVHFLALHGGISSFPRSDILLDLFVPMCSASLLCHLFQWVLSTKIHALGSGIRLWVDASLCTRKL